MTLFVLIEFLSRQKLLLSFLLYHRILPTEFEAGWGQSHSLLILDGVKYTVHDDDLLLRRHKRALRWGVVAFVLRMVVKHQVSLLAYTSVSFLLWRSEIFVLYCGVSPNTDGMVLRVLCCLWLSSCQWRSSTSIQRALSSLDLSLSLW